ncbi:MAG: hypothetical protein KF891_05135 [Rhizobacter sp.]|nr:hypothetical protein [Rhizobacter sp.]
MTIDQALHQIGIEAVAHGIDDSGCLRPYWEFIHLASAKGERQEEPVLAVARSIDQAWGVDRIAIGSPSTKSNSSLTLPGMRSPLRVEQRWSSE